ncbi:MAG: hypothetical protein JKY56_24890 [Kofleriaceae bacterium]|nr:hypothetical protein [Kofleriaceae bacterium]
MGIPPNEHQSKLAWLCVVSLTYYTAVTIADTVAQSIFVARLGVAALPNIFLLKAAIDVISALAYLPLTRGRNPERVWRVLLLLYGTSVAIGWWAVSGTLSLSLGAYLLYVGHEVAWTLAVIHWGIFLLSLLGPIESRRFFPVLFGVGRLGALLGGLLVTAFAVQLGTANLLGIVLFLTLFCALASLKLKNNSGFQTRQKTDERGGGWRDAAAQPLVRAIAVSTATMVMLRYGLRMVSLAEIRGAFDSDKDQIAAFLGLVAVLGNALALVLGIWVVPRLLARIGVGATNLLYASTTLIAFATTWLFPGLASASSARFVEMPPKHALKTPLSVLFYGGEKPSHRAAARSLVFGLAIPLAAICTGLGFRYGRPDASLISLLGIAIALIYLGVCRWQNKQYQNGLSSQLQALVAGETPSSGRQEGWQSILGQCAPKLPKAQVKYLCAGLASPSQPTHELARALLGELLSPAQQRSVGKLEGDTALG